MATDRRSFLLGAGMSLLGVRSAHARTQPYRFLAPQADWRGKLHSAGVFDPKGNEGFAISTSFRGHSIQVDPSNPDRALMFGQRPSPFMCELDLVARTVVRDLEAKPGQHFYGHGRFSVDGKYLFATENHVASGQGLITVRDAQTLQELEIFPSHGVGPHDLRVIDDGKTLLIANGGIVSDPSLPSASAYGAIDSALTFVDLGSGKLLDHQKLKDPNLSIRHLAVSPDGSIAAGIARHGPARIAPILLARHRRGPFREITAPGKIVLHMGGTLSLSIHQRSGRLAATSRGARLATVWDMKTGACLKHYALDEACGVALFEDQSHWLVTVISGRNWQLDTDTLELKPSSIAGLNWRHLNVG